MRLCLISSSILALVSAIGAAQAADLPLVTKAPAQVGAYNWTGFYLGANVGYGISGNSSAAEGTMTGDSSFDSHPGNNTPYSVNAHREGVIGGIQFGYNYQLAMSAVVGLEADFQGAALSSASGGTLTGMLQNAKGDDGAVGSVSGSHALKWFGTVRGRVGYTGLDPRIMPYLTGGLAYGKVENSLSVSFQHFGCLAGINPGACSSATATDSSVKVGWTLGGGVEWAPAALSNWSLKAEYLYIGLPSSTLTPFGSNSNGATNSFVAANGKVDNSFHVVRLGLNYKFGNYGPALDAAVARPLVAPVRVANRWTGFYAGVNVGYGISGNASATEGSMTGDSTYDSHPGSNTPYSINAHREGVIGGVQFGYNYQLAMPAVVGLEADFQGAALSSTSGTTLTGMLQNAIADDGAVGSVSGSNALKWFGTVRGRIGYTGLDPRMMPYLTGGLAYGKVENSITAGFQHYGCVRGDTGPNPTACAFATATDNSVKVGWTLGGGVEWAPAALPNWSLKAEYLYIGLPSSTLTPSGTNAGPSDRGFINTFVSGNGTVDNSFHIVRLGLNYKFGN